MSKKRKAVSTSDVPVSIDGESLSDAAIPVGEGIQIQPSEVATLPPDGYDPYKAEVDGFSDVTLESGRVLLVAHDTPEELERLVASLKVPAETKKHVGIPQAGDETLHFLRDTGEDGKTIELILRSRAEATEQYKRLHGAR